MKPKAKKIFILVGQLYVARATVDSEAARQAERRLGHTNDELQSNMARIRNVLHGCGKAF